MTRISATQGDDGYGQYLVCRENDKWPKIFLNGVEIDNVITADDERSMIVKLVMDEDKRPVVDYGTDNFATETLRGDVSLVWEK